MNHRYFVLVLFLACIRISGNAQEYPNQPEFELYRCPNYNSGCYENYKEFNAGTPVLTSGFFMQKRSPSEIRDSRAGGYSLCFDGDNPSEGKPTNKIWGVYYEDTLYLNRNFFQHKKGFDKVYCLGNIGYFHGINPHSGSASEGNILNTALIFGLLGGLVAEALYTGNNNHYGKFPHVMIYLIDYQTGLISPLTRFKLEKILEYDQKLLDLYENEKNKSSMLVMHAYLDTFAERHKNR